MQGSQKMYIKTKNIKFVKTVQYGRGGEVGNTNSIANLAVATAKNGRKAKQRTKQTKAATLHAPKMSSRSHRLTVVQRSCQ